KPIFWRATCFRGACLGNCSSTGMVKNVQPSRLRRPSVTLFAHDAASGLRALIAIHDTTLGPAFGGCRMYPDASEHQAMADVLRLSRGMTYKSPICELPYGGGKSVIIADPRRDKTPALLHAMGRLVEDFSGRYIVADDVGTTLADLVVMREVTR